MINGNNNNSEKINLSNNHSALMENSLDEGYKSGIIVNKNGKSGLKNRKVRIGMIHKTPPKEKSQGVGVGVGTEIKKREDHDH